MEGNGNEVAKRYSITSEEEYNILKPDALTEDVLALKSIRIGKPLDESKAMVHRILPNTTTGTVPKLIKCDNLDDVRTKKPNDEGDLLKSEHLKNEHRQIRKKVTRSGSSGGDTNSSNIFVISGSSRNASVVSNTPLIEEDRRGTENKEDGCLICCLRLFCATSS